MSIRRTQLNTLCITLAKQQSFRFGNKKPPSGGFFNCVQQLAKMETIGPEIPY